MRQFTALLTACVTLSQALPAGDIATSAGDWSQREADIAAFEAHDAITVTR